MTPNYWVYDHPKAGGRAHWKGLTPLSGWGTKWQVVLPARAVGAGVGSVPRRAGLGAALAAVWRRLLWGARCRVGAARAGESGLCQHAAVLGIPQSAWSYTGHGEGSKGRGWHLSRGGGEPLKRLGQQRKGKKCLYCISESGDREG